MQRHDLVAGRRLHEWEAYSDQLELQDLEAHRHTSSSQWSGEPAFAPDWEAPEYEDAEPGQDPNYHPDGTPLDVCEFIARNHGWTDWPEPDAEDDYSEESFP